VVLQGGGGGTSVEAEKKLAAMSQLQYDYSQLQKELKALHEQIDDSKGHESMIRSLSDAKIMLQATRSNTTDNMQLQATCNKTTRQRDNIRQDKTTGCPESLLLSDAKVCRRTRLPSCKSPSRDSRSIAPSQRSWKRGTLAQLNSVSNAYSKYSPSCVR
jgi:hypothetical protein